MAAVPIVIGKVFVIGCGSIGQRHIGNLAALGVARIAAFDPDPERREAARSLGAQIHDSLESGLQERPEAVLICTPPHLHMMGMRLALEADAHCFVEKPISHSMEGIEAVVKLANEKQRVLMVGYMLRFEPGLRKVKALLDSGAIGRLLLMEAEFGQYLPDWRPTQDYRQGYNVSARMGGGIILDASHEIDYVRWLAGEIERVYCVAGKLSDLEMDVEDAAAMTFECSGRVIAEVHLDSLQRMYSRNCKLIGSDGVITWDLRGGVRHSGPDREWHVIETATDSNQMYVDELRHFLAAANGEVRPECDGRDAARVLQIALAARESASSGQPVVLN